MTKNWHGRADSNSHQQPQTPVERRPPDLPLNSAAATHQMSAGRAARGRSVPRLVSLMLAMLLSALLLLNCLSATTGFVGSVPWPILSAQLTERAVEWLPDPPAMRTHVLEGQHLPQTATLTASDGKVLAEFNDLRYGRRTAVPLSEISPYLVQATVATEDGRFYDHHGVDLLGMIRAVGQNLESERVRSGASTIEMQVVRNLFLFDERSEQTLSRKLREIARAIELDRRFSKSEIMETYLNVVFYGNRAYGAEAAAQVYFDNSARDLTLAEAALLAGLPQSPTRFDPVSALDLAKQRQDQVLTRMVDEGMISDRQADEARAAPLDIRAPLEAVHQFPHWVDYTYDVVRSRVGPEALFTGGLQINTTLDPAVQEMAEDVVADAEPIRQLAHANNSAMVVLDVGTNRIRAMVGSKDFADASIDGQVNLALSGRQPGSSIKPLVYLAAFEQGLNPRVEVVDEPTHFSAPRGQPDYQPVNWEDQYHGQTTLRDALGNSLNVPAVKILKYIGVPVVQDLAKRLGITTLDQWDPEWLSLTLGGGEVRLLELAGAYATIARGGVALPTEPLLEVQAADGQPLYEAAEQPEGQQVVDPRVAYQLLSVMGDPGARQVTFGAASPLNLSRPHMVKTGTTDDYRDTWTVGCLPQVCVGVWMGNTEAEPMVRVSSSLTAGKLWVEMIQRLTDYYQYEPVAFTQPDGVIVKQVTSDSATRPAQQEYDEVFVPGHEDVFLLDMDWKGRD